MIGSLLFLCRFSGFALCDLFLILQIVLLSSCRQIESTDPARDTEIEIIIRSDDSEFLRRTYMGDTDYEEKIGELTGEKSGTMIVNHRYRGELFMSSEGIIKEGALEGSVATYGYSADGKYLGVEQYYESDLRNGKITTYYPSGELRCEGEFRNDYRHGLFRFYYNDRSIAAEFEFDEGIIVGRAVAYSDSGRVVADGTYSRGVPLDGAFVPDPDEFVRHYSFDAKVPITKHEIRNGEIVGEKEVLLANSR